MRQRVQGLIYGLAALANSSSPEPCSLSLTVGISTDMFVTPFVKVKGTLSSPSVGLNKKGTLLTGGAAFATGGLSLLLKGVFDRATAEGDKCEKALEMAGQHTSYEF